jgi:hydrogenase maturation factor
MCQSRFHQVRTVTRPGMVLVENVDGRLHEVSLLALEPEEPVPVPGDWLVVHSGYAIDRAEAREAERALAELGRSGVHVHPFVRGLDRPAAQVRSAWSGGAVEV